MSDNSLDDLLRPSLNGLHTSGKMFSLLSHFLVAFIGGPIALVLFGIWSVNGIGRLKNHALLLTGLMIAALAGTALVTLLATEGLNLIGDPSTTARTLLRLWGLCLFGMVYLTLRKYFNMAGFNYSPDPSPWIPGVVTILLGIGLQFVLTLILIVAFDLEAI